MDEQTNAQHIIVVERVSPDDSKFRTLRCPREQSEEQNGEDVQGNPYEFSLLLQKLKSGGMSFDTFLEQALEWATMRSITARRP